MRLNMNNSFDSFRGKDKMYKNRSRQNILGTMRLDERFCVDIFVVCSVVEIDRPVGCCYKGREIIVVVVVVGCCCHTATVRILCGRDLKIRRTGCTGRRRGRHSVTRSNTVAATVVARWIFSPDSSDQTGQEIARNETRRLLRRLRWRSDDFMRRHLWCVQFHLNAGRTGSGEPQW